MARRSEGASLATRVALPICRGRISPVFDVAQRLRLVEIRDGVAIDQVEHLVGGDRVRGLAELGVRVLICGAVSCELERDLRAQRIEVISGIRGPVDEVVEAYLADRLRDQEYVMPGS